jgi:hypothetical protein
LTDAPGQFTIRPYREADQADVMAFQEHLGFSIDDVTTLGKRLS